MGWFPWEHSNLTADMRMANTRPLAHALFYEPRQRLRPLRVMVSADLLHHRLADQRVEFLLQLLAMPPVESMLFDLDGPPGSALKAQDVDTGCESFVDWIAIDSTDSSVPPVILHWKEGRPVRTVMRRTDSILSRFDGDLQPAILIGDRANCDLLVTGLNDLPDAAISDWSRLTVMQAREALPLVGLYLRRQGRFVRHRSPALGQRSAQSTDVVETQSEFFWRAANVFIPAAAAGPSTHRAPLTIPTSGKHRKAVIWRFQQVLQARDRLLGTLAVAPRDYETADRAASELELILMWLMAAFDITARLIHVEYAHEDILQRAGWQNTKWRKTLSPKRDDLVAFFRGNTPAGAVVSVVEILRNSVHGAEPVSGSGTSFVAGPNAMECLVTAPTDERSQLINALIILGGLEAWGIQRDRETKSLRQ